MASRKELKKSIQLISSTLISEAYIAHKLIGKMDESEFNDTLMRIAAVNNDFLSRTNHPEPGMKAGVYYAKLRADFDAKMAEIIDILEKK